MTDKELQHIRNMGGVYYRARWYTCNTCKIRSATWLICKHWTWYCDDHIKDALQENLAQKIANL